MFQDFMSGKTAFRNIMSILLPGVNSVIAERSSQLYGKLLENAVQLSLEIIILVFDKDLLLSDYWLPLYQVTQFSKQYTSNCFHGCVRTHQTVHINFKALGSSFFLFLLWIRTNETPCKIHGARDY